MIGIILLGIGERSNELELLTLEALSKIPVDVKMEVINDSRAILKYNVKRIPALLVDNEIVFEGRLPKEDEIVNSIQEKIYSINKKDKKMVMSKILVPIDFSETSLKGFRYAKEMAEEFGASITVVHVSKGLLDDDSTPTLIPLKTREKTMLGNMKEFVGLTPNMEGPRERVKVDFRYEVGFPVERIVALSPQFDLIVIGATGEHGVVDKLFGSVSSGVAQRAKCPVLLVNGNHIFTPYRNILNAAKSNALNPKITARLLAASNDPGKTVHFVEVSNRSEFSDKEIVDGISEVYLKNGLKDIDFTVAHVQEDSVVKGLNRYSEENDIDLIVMNTKEKSLLGRLFLESQTKNIAQSKMNAPVLVIHE